MRVDQGLLERRLAGAGDHDLPAGVDDLVGRRQHEVDALLVHESRDDAEHRAAGDREPELLAHVIRIGSLAGPVAGAELLGELGAGTRVPALVDAVEDAGELGGVRAQAKQALQSAAELGRGDLPGIGAADGGEVRGVDQARLEEGDLVVELDAVDVEGALRCADPPQRVLREEALIGEVMNGQDRRQLGAAPGKVRRHERGLPVIGMDQICCPILVQLAHRELSRRRGKAREADVVVGPIAPGLVAIGVAWTIVELRAQQHIDRQAVLGRGPAERAGRHLRECGTAANDLNVRELLDDVAIAGQHDPDIGEGAKRTGKGGGNGAQSANADEVVHLCGDEQDPQEQPPSSDPVCCYARTGPVILEFPGTPMRRVCSVKTFLLSRRPLGWPYHQKEH